MLGIPMCACYSMRVRDAINHIGVGIKGIGKSIKVGLHDSCEKSDSRNMDRREEWRERNYV